MLVATGNAVHLPGAVSGWAEARLRDVFLLWTKEPENRACLRHSRDRGGGGISLLFKFCFPPIEEMFTLCLPECSLARKAKALALPRTAANIWAQKL